MNQNLDFDLNNQTTLTNENTDLNGDITTWKPLRSTIAPGNLSSSTWQSDTITPYSYDVGDKYYVNSGSSEDDTLRQVQSVATPSFFTTTV